MKQAGCTSRGQRDRVRQRAVAARTASHYVAERLESRVLLSNTVGMETLGASPAMFVENQGQWADAATRFALLGSSMTVRFTADGLDFRLAGRAEESPAETGDEGPAMPWDEPAAAVQWTSFSMRFDGASVTQPLGYDPMGVTNFMLGEPSTWRTDVPSFAGLVYPDLYPGIDLHIRGLKGSLKYEFHVDPGVDYRQIQVRYEGIEGLSLAADGSLHVATAIGSIVDAAPVVYQEGAGGRQELPGRYELLGEAVHGFVVDGVDTALPLVIDPELAWGTYLGGGNGGGSEDYGHGIAVDDSGNVLVTGGTASSGWISGGWDTSPNGGWDAFVMKFSQQGEHLWSTYLGGTGSDVGNGVTVDGSGNALVTGETWSSGWVSGGWDTSHNGGWDAFVVKLSPQGQHLWSTYLGGGRSDSGSGIAVDGSDNVLVTGETYNSGWLTGGWDTIHNGGLDAFVLKLDPQGQHLWSTYLGGTGSDVGNGIAVDGSGNILVTGETASSGWVSGGWDTSHNRDQDAFVVKLSPHGQHVWSTYLGGTDSDVGNGVAVDGLGNVLVTGYTFSPGWVSGGWDTSHNGGQDAFVTKLDHQGEHLWTTYLGAGGWDAGFSIAVDSAGSALLTGETYHSGWVSGGWDTSDNGKQDAFVAKLSPQGEHLWSTCLGGAMNDNARGITVDDSGNVLMAGSTSSGGWVSGGWDTSPNGGPDAFVMKFSQQGEHLWSTYLGGGGDDYGRGVTVDGFGNVLATGYTWSSGWVSGGWDTVYDGGYDAFLVKLSPQGQHLWSTYLGGGSDEHGYGIAVDDSGNVLVTGRTDSSGWVSGGWDTSLSVQSDAFVVKLSPQGQHLWSTYLGGASTDYGRGISVDDSGNVLVTGSTSSAGWVSGGWDTSLNGGPDAFVVKLSPQGQHLWSTYIGGTDTDYGYGIAVDSTGSILVTGETYSSGWTSGGWDASYDGGSDAFVVKLSSEGQHLWSTYLGGTGLDAGNGIAVDSAGSVLVTGTTFSSGWTSGGWDTSYDGGYDAFVVKLSPQGQHLWSTYLGSKGVDVGNGIAVDYSDNVLVTGDTGSFDWISDGSDTSYDGGYDAFVVKLSPQGQHLWSTYLDGTDRGFGIAVDCSGNVLVTGETYTSGWLSGGWDSSYNGGQDAFVVKIIALATPLLTGTSSGDAYYLRVNPDNPQQIQVFLGNAAVGSPVSLLDGQGSMPLVLRGIGGQDSLTIDLAHGNPLVTLGLSIESGRFTLNLVGGSMLDLPSLALAPSATLDLGEQGLALRSGDWAGILALIAAGRDGGTWTGTGLTSSYAARPENAGKGLAVMRNDAGDETPLLATVNGQALGLDAILIVYTWHGDSDLNGAIDGDDYFRLDAGFITASAGPTYRTGDLNHDGQVDGRDYHLIDLAFLAQWGALPALPEAAVPSSLLAGAEPESKAASGARFSAQPIALEGAFVEPPVIHPTTSPGAIFGLAAIEPDRLPELLEEAMDVLG